MRGNRDPFNNRRASDPRQPPRDLTWTWGTMRWCTVRPFAIPQLHCLAEQQWVNQRDKGSDYYYAIHLKIFQDYLRQAGNSFAPYGSFYVAMSCSSDIQNAIKQTKTRRPCVREAFCHDLTLSSIAYYFLLFCR